MKILQINATNKYGSTGTNIQELKLYFQEKGHSCFNAVAYGEDADYYIGCKLDRNIHGLLSRVFGMQGYFSITSTIRLIKWINDIKPNIILLNNVHGNYLNFRLIVKYCTQKSIPVVFVLHDCWFYTGKCCHYTVDGCYKWKTISCRHCPRNHLDNSSWFFDCTNRMINDKYKLYKEIKYGGIIGVSQWILNEAKQSIMTSIPNKVVIYNWVNLDVFKPAQCHIEDEFIILAVCSDWQYSKGLNDALELSKMLPKGTKLCLIGNIIERGINKEDYNILFIPRTENREELVRWYNRAGVFINFSLEESFGKVTAEALACGTPVIVKNSTASPELVGEGCGYVVSGESVKDILAKCLIVKENGKSYYSAKCRRFAVNNFDYRANAEKYLDFLEAVVEKV